jgi:glyoxylase-like metal-dependent hydrolase (beta-lactamase superfamily II)
MRNQDLMKRVKGPVDVPNEPHFAVILYETRSIYHEGDERSRTCPGHGYPAHTETLDAFEHWVTTEKSYLEEFITELDARTGYDKKPYVILEVTKKGSVARSTTVQF